jgi:hypothetical protein
MNLPKLEGIIRRRILVNFRANPQIIQPLLPAKMHPKLHNGYALVGICLIRLEQMRPAGLPNLVGFSSENAAHRIAVQWDEVNGTREAVYIPRRDTNSVLNLWLGGRVFPAELHAATFDVRADSRKLEMHIRSRDHAVQVDFAARVAQSLSTDSVFASLEQARVFFQNGSLGYSRRLGQHHLDGVELQTGAWTVEPLEVVEVHSSYFAAFPKGEIEFDHALLLRNLPNVWHSRPPFLLGDDSVLRPPMPPSLLGHSEFDLIKPPQLE